MSVESTLHRQLDIRFIDARTIVTEAKGKLMTVGYLDSQQRELVEREAVRIFHSLDDGEKQEMHRANAVLEFAKNPEKSSEELAFRPGGSRSRKSSAAATRNINTMGNHSFLSSSNRSDDSKLSGTSATTTDPYSRNSSNSAFGKFLGQRGR